MAGREAKERNRAVKGRTGLKSRKRRKRLNMKSRLWGKGHTPAGTHSSPTDPQGSVKPKAKS